MGRFVAARLGHAIVVSFLVTTVAFFLIHAAPADPFSFDSPRFTEELRTQLRAQFGYDKPLAEQYARFVASMAAGQFGYSHSLHVPVREAILVAMPRTIGLMAGALVLAFALGIWLGVFESRHEGTSRARFANGFSMVVISLPGFWVAMIILLTLAYWIPAFPAGGIVDPFLHDYMSPWRALVDRLWHLVLPLAALTLIATAAIARFQRAAVMEVIHSDFVRTARAKGVAEGPVFTRHALRNALLPMITLAGLMFPALLGGAVFVERIFAWPGMGLVLTNAVFARDYPLVLATVLIGSVMVVIGNALADIGYAIADPRIRVH